MKQVASRENALFKRFRLLASSTSEQRRQGRTLIDGPHLVAAWCNSCQRPFQLIVSETGASHGEILHILSSHPDIPVVVMRDALFREISGTATPVGIVAEISVIAPPALDTAVQAPGDWLLLDAIQDAGNVGSILRSAAALGVKRVFLNERCATPWSPKVLRAAQGAHLVLEIWERADLSLILDQFSGKKLATLVTNARPIYEENLVDRVLWLFGNEGKGVSAELAAKCDNYVIIPMSNASESLNVAAAAAICLAEASRQRSLQ